MNVIEILIPLYLLISLGFVLKHYHFPSDDFWVGLERMIYYILFPSLLFVALLKAPINSMLFGDVLLAITVPTLLIGFTQWLGFLAPNLSGSTFSSMYQGAVRNNTAIGLVIAPWILPENGLTIMAVVILIMVPYNNLASVTILSIYGKKNQKQSPSLWKGIFYNPLILACIAGLLLNLFTFVPPQSLIETTDFLGRSALPLALLSVGAGLKIKSIFQRKVAIILSSAGRLLVLPSIVWFICIFFEIDTDISKVAIIFAAVPTATSAYILSKQMGGDSEAMAQIITFQTLAAAFTLPIFLSLLQSL